MPEEEGDDQLRRLQEALNSDPENPSHHFEIGLHLWKRGEEEGSKELKERAVEHFVVSAKLNPSSGAAFRYLGHYYSKVSVDEQRASKCYLRAVNLNPEDFESGVRGLSDEFWFKAILCLGFWKGRCFLCLFCRVRPLLQECLCDLLDGGGKESLEIAVCREASERSPKAFWAFRRIGYLLVHQKKWSEAVQSLQQAIRGYPTCADLWESYGRAVELEDSKILALIESGNIHLMLGSFRQGIEQFRRALEVSPKNVSAHFGLASALLGLSKECISYGAFSWATSLLKEASEVAKASTCLAGNYSSLWKLHGDIELYRNSGNQHLAKQAFDRARSIDPSLALPWAGMSVGSPARESLMDEAYESCLRAVQMLPLPEFQIGLGKLATLSGHLLSPQVFGAIQQAVQRAPYYPESHNLKGLVCEARLDYRSAIAAYWNARYALNIFFKSPPKSQVADISVNLARSLCQAGHVSDAEHVCEELKRKGLLDSIGRQLYVIALWQQGKKESFLPEAAQLAKNIPDMDRTSGAAALGLICRLVYCSLGQDHAVRTILKSPRELLQNSKMSFLVTALCAFDPSSPLHSLIPCDLPAFSSEEVIEMHCLTAVSKLLANESCMNMGIKSAQRHLRKALHMNPDSGFIRKQLSSLLLCGKDWMASHIAIRCIPTPGGPTFRKDSKSAYEILGSATVACYNSCTGRLGLSFPSCKGRLMPVAKRIHQLQKWFHEEPWNCKAQYLLILCLFQKAREEKFPQNLCVTLKHLVSSALSQDIYLKENQLYLYQKFQLLLCASEIYLQSGDHLGCISQADEASRLPIHDSGCFFAHLQLCRGYAVLEDWQNLGKEYVKCLQHRTCHEIGWISLKYLESRYRLQTNVSAIDLNFATCLKENEQSQNMWAAVFDLVCSQSFVWNQDFFHAEEALAHACSMEHVDSCLLLCHGAVCMELARQQAGSHFLSLAVESLTKAREISPAPLPIVSALLAQAVASLGAKDQWAKNLRSEWFSWPAEMRPAELYFQMHLIAGRPNAGSKRYSVESSQSPEKWVLRAIHINPSSLRYWKALQKLMEL